MSSQATKIARAQTFDEWKADPPNAEVIAKMHDSCGKCEGGIGDAPCPNCHGDGTDECCECGHETECRECDGTGVVDGPCPDCEKRLKALYETALIEDVRRATSLGYTVMVGDQVVTLEKGRLVYQKESGE